MSQIEAGNHPAVKKCFSFLNYSTKNDFPFIEGGISSDSRFAWQFGGSCLMVVDLIRESLLSRLDLKTVTNSKDTKITAVIECPVFDTSHESKNWNKPWACLIVAYYNIGERGSGHILILHPSTNRILETICVSDHVTAMEIITTKWISGCPLRGILRRMSGSLAYGTIEGRVFVLDLKHSGLAYRLYGKLKNQIEVKKVNELLMVDVHRDDNDQVYEMIRECYSSEKRIAFQLIPEGSSNDGNVILDVKRDKYGEYSTVTAMKYIPQTLFLAVGTQIGVFKLWNMSDYTCMYTSAAKEVSISHFQFQEPCNDPHNMCYLWVMFESTKPLKKCLPYANMFRITFKDMSSLGPYGTYYSNIQQRRTEKKFAMVFDNKAGINGRWVTSQIIVSKRSSYANLDNTITDEEASKLNLFVATFEAWDGERRTLKTIVFDMNQWYRHLMPSNYSQDLSFPFANTIALSKLNIPKCSLFDIRVKEETIFHFPTYNAGQKENHPSSLSFEGLLMYESKVIDTHFVGAQKYVFNAITNEGPMAIVNPKHHYELVRSAGLISQFCKIENVKKPTLADQREFLMSVLLEYRLPNLLKGCISEWSDGSKTISGCTLPFILEWAWSTALRIKKLADRLCVTLFDYSGIELDKENYQKLRNWKHSLISILDLLEYALDNYKEYLLENTLEGQVESLRAVTKYFDVLIWCLDCNLLPEKADEENDLIPAYFKKVTETTRTRRNQLEELSRDESDSEKKPFSLIIDEIISMEPRGKKLLEQWKNESYGLCDGLYPPSNLQSIIRMFLLPNYSVETKYAIFTYFLMDTGLNIEFYKKERVNQFYVFRSRDAQAQLVYGSTAAGRNQLGTENERMANPMPASKHFSVIFGLSQKLYMMAQAYWHIDHGSFEEGSDLLLNGHFSTEDIPHCLHMKILKMLVHSEDKSVILKYIQIMRPNFCGSEEHKFHITLLLLNGLLMDAFKITKNVTPMRNELLHHFFQACDTLGHLKKVFHIPMSYEEEQAFALYLDSCKTEEADTLRVMYLFSTGRYPEAIDTNKKLNMIRPTSGLGRHSGPGKNNLSTRDMIANAFEKTLPPITRDLLAFQAKDKSFLFQNLKPSANPTPLSSILHTDINDRRPDFKGSNDFVMQSAMMKTRELWNNNYVPPLNKNLKVRSDVELIPFLRSGRYETSERFARSAKVNEKEGTSDSFISIKRKMTEDTQIPVKRSRLNENLVSDEEKSTIESNELINTSFVGKKFSVSGRAIEVPASILKNTVGTRIKHTRKVDFSEPLEEPKTPPISVAPISRLPTPHISRIVKNDMKDSPSDSPKEISSNKTKYSMESEGDEGLFGNFELVEIEEKNESTEKGFKGSQRELSFSTDNSTENVTPSETSATIGKDAKLSSDELRRGSTNADFSTGVLQVEEFDSESSESSPEMDYDVEEGNAEVEMVDANDLIAPASDRDRVPDYQERDTQFESHREIRENVNIPTNVPQPAPSAARSVNVSQDEEITIIDLDSDESDAADYTKDDGNSIGEFEGDEEWDEEVDESDEVSDESEGGSYESEGESIESEKISPESPDPETISPEQPEKTYLESWKSEEKSWESEESDEQSRESWEPEEGVQWEEPLVVEESPPHLAEEGSNESEEQDYAITFGSANRSADYDEMVLYEQIEDDSQETSHAGVEEENLAAYSDFVVEEYVTSVAETDNETADSNVTQPANTLPAAIGVDLISSVEMSSDMMRNIQDILRNQLSATEESQKEERASEMRSTDENIAGYKQEQLDPNIEYVVRSSDSDSQSDNSNSEERKETAGNKSVGRNPNMELVVESESDSDTSSESSKSDSSKGSKVENSSFNILLHASSQQKNPYSDEEDEAEYNYEEDDEADEDNAGSSKNPFAEDEDDDDDDNFGELGALTAGYNNLVEHVASCSKPVISPPVIIVTKDSKRSSEQKSGKTFCITMGVEKNDDIERETESFITPLVEPGPNNVRLSERLVRTPPKRSVATPVVTPKKENNAGVSKENTEITPSTSGLKFLSEITTPKEEAKAPISRSIFDDMAYLEKPNIVPIFFGNAATSPVSEILLEISASEMNGSKLFGTPGSRKVEASVAEEENMEIDVSEGEIKDENGSKVEQPTAMECEVENLTAEASEADVRGFNVAGTHSKIINISESIVEISDENVEQFAKETRVCDNIAFYSGTLDTENKTAAMIEPSREQLISETVDIANAVSEVTTIEYLQLREQLFTEPIASSEHLQEQLIYETVDIANETTATNERLPDLLISEAVDITSQITATNEPSQDQLISETIDITNQTTATYEPSQDQLILETVEIANQSTATNEPSQDQSISKTINITDTVYEITTTSAHSQSQAQVISETINLTDSDEDESEMEFKRSDNSVIQQTILLTDSDEEMEDDGVENQDEIREREKMSKVEDNITKSSSSDESHIMEKIMQPDIQIVRMDSVAVTSVPAGEVRSDMDKTKANSQEEEEKEEIKMTEIPREIETDPESVDGDLIVGDTPYSAEIPDYSKGDSFDVNDRKVLTRGKRTKTSRASSGDYEEYLNRDKSLDDSRKSKRITRSTSAENVILDPNFHPRRYSTSHVTLKVDEKTYAACQPKNEISNLANAGGAGDNVSGFIEKDEPFENELSESRKMLTAVRKSRRPKTRSSSMSAENIDEDTTNTRSLRRRSTSMVPSNSSGKQEAPPDKSIPTESSHEDLKRASSTSMLLASGAKKVGKSRRVSAGSVFELKDSSKVSKISGHSLKPIKETDELSDFSEETRAGDERKVNTPKKRRKREISSSKESLNESVTSQPERKTRSQLRKAQEHEESTLVDEIENVGTKTLVGTPPRPPRTPERRLTRASSRLSSFNDSSDKSGNSSPVNLSSSLPADSLSSDLRSASQPMPVTPGARSKNFASSTPLATVPEDEPLQERRMTRNQKNLMEEYQKGITPTKSKPTKKAPSGSESESDANVASTSTARPVQKARRGRPRKNK